MATSPEPVPGAPSFWAPPVVRIGGLGLLLWGIASEVRPATSGRHLAFWLLVAALVPAWLTWGWSPPASIAAGRRQVAAVSLLAAVGGVLSAFAPLALAFVAVAALGAAMAFSLGAALGLATLGPTAAGIAAAVGGRSVSIVLATTAVSLAGLVVGVARRLHADRAAHAALVAVEHERAEILAERNRLAREIHDVLAHTLGALAVQLEAIDAQLEPDVQDASALRAALRRTRALAVDGLADARRAVQALRDDDLPLPGQLERLCATSGAELAVEGRPQPLTPEVALTLFRSAQEALTNATKHAPGARVAVELLYEADVVGITVSNAPAARSPGELAASGGGYGIEGLSERVRLLGGSVSAGPHDGGWRVAVRVPR